jgi:Trypsin-like peptidase domain
MYLNRRTLLTSGPLFCLTSLVRPVGASMIEPKSITEHLMYSTARIVGKIPNSTDFKTGSGFFFNFPTEDGLMVPVLVTNKHVIDGTDGLQFLIHTATTPEAKAPSANAEIQSVASDWISHPNPKIDLCGLVIGPVLNSMNPLHPFFRSIGPPLMKTDDELKELDAVEQILMVGYPNGLWDATNNFPLLRRGITASHPGVDFDVNGVATTVVDIGCFPGSSGSPVFIYNDGSYANKSGGGLSLGTRVIFLGVLYSGPIFQPDGSIVVKNIPTGNVPVPLVNMMMNLGYIIKAKEVAELGMAVFAKHNIKAPSAAPQAAK